MDAAAEIGSVDPLEARSEGLSASVGAKRPAEDGGGCDLSVSSSAKKARGGGGGCLAANTKKVAEIVLVLAAMGSMRAGRSPTAAEMQMMAEARGKLVEICEVFAPKDVFPRDAFGVVIDDLGLNKLREQRLGFRPPKMSIVEKLSLAKQKMERSAEFSLHSGTYTPQRSQTNSGPLAESRGPSNAVRVFSSEKPNYAPISSGGFQPTSSLGHVSAIASTTPPHQLPASEVKLSTVSSGLPASHLGKDSSSLPLPRVERSQFRSDGRSNGSSYTLHGQVNFSGDHLQTKTPTWSLQPSSASSAKIGSDSKIPDQPSAKVERNAHISTSHVAAQATIPKPFTTQTTSGNMPNIHQHLQGMNFVQAPSVQNSHNEIGKIIQKFFQKQLFDRPSWTPPSRDYMNKAVTCQICKESINDVESVLLCDACEKGYHLKCIQFNNQKGIPRGEWHCAKCLMLSNGKPLPPKYGRVMRNMSAPKMSSNTRADQLSLCKRVGSLDEKVGQQKVAVNGIHGLQSVSTVTMGNSHNNSANSNMPNTRDQSTNVSSVKEIKDVKSFSGTGQDDVSKTAECASVSPAGSVGEGVGDVKLVSETEGPHPAKLPETVADRLDQSETFHNRQDTDLSEEPNNTEIPPEPHDDNKLIGNDLEKTNKGEISNCNSDGKPDEQRVAQANIVETSGTGNQASENLWSSSDSLHTVDWIGDVLQVVDEKRYYQSCCINGIVYKLQDHTLVRFSSNKLMPSKLQAMWEDSKSTLKWITVSQCYFPEDLPEVVGRPCAPEPNEVYESNHVTTMMAGLVQGACEVLPPTEFVEENGRSGHSGTSSNDGLRPVFLCKWFFDESKGVFRDVSS